jgi:tetratricopeptide (TPR) repeat protein
MADERNREMPVTFQPIPPPSEVTGEQSIYWLAPESATRELAPGLYRVKLVPGAGQATDWKLESANLRVVTPNAERRNLLAVLLVRRLLLLGREDDALAEADRAIAADAKDQNAWIVKGDIFMQKDMPDEALEAYDSALKLHKKADGEPLTITTRRRAAFFRSLEKRGVVSPQKPAP